MRRTVLIPSLVFALFAFSAVSAWPAEYAVNCSNIAGLDKAWQLPVGSGFKDLEVMTLPNSTGGDMIITAQLFYPINNTANTRLSFQVTVDGTKYGPSFVGRLPDNFSSSQFFRVVAPNVPVGNHTVRLQANNLSATPIEFYDSFVSAHVIDSAETTASNLGSTEVAFDGSWTTLQSVTIQVASGKIVQLGGTFRIYTGTPGNRLEYRFVDGTTQLALFEGSVPDPVNDFATVAYVVGSPTTGSRTYQLQARRTSGSTTVTVLDRYLFAQTIPNDATHPHVILEASGTYPSPVPMDGQYHAVISSPANDQVVPSFVSGFSNVTLPAQTSTPLRFRQQILHSTTQNGTYTAYSFDNGLTWVSASGSQSLLAGSGQADGCGGCGFNSTYWYKTELWVQSLCTSSGGSILLDRAQLQLMLWDNSGYNSTGFTCAQGSQLLGPLTGYPRCP